MAKRTRELEELRSEISGAMLEAECLMRRAETMYERVGSLEAELSRHPGASELERKLASESRIAAAAGLDAIRGLLRR